MTRLKLFGKDILRKLNTSVGNVLPVVDLRGGGNIDGASKTFLTGEAPIKGDIDTYHYDKTAKAPYWIELFREGVTVPPLFMLVLYNVRMVSRGVIIHQNKVLLESAIFQREYLDKLLANHSILVSLYKRQGTTISNAIPLLNKLSNNYYHWTTESLTRLAALSEYSNEDYYDYNIIIAADAPAFERESLIALFKVKEEKIITWKNNDKGIIEKCILISYPFIRTEETVMMNVYNLPLDRLLNTISLRNISSLTNEAEYIVISRKNVNQRKLLGEEKILNAFPAIPFKIIYTEEMSYIEQVRTFRNAKIIIAPHGAGLVNLVYVTKKPVVIEIFPTTRKIRDAGAYHQIAREMEIDYHLLVKEPANDEQDIEITDTILSEIKDILSLYKY